MNIVPLNISFQMAILGAKLVAWNDVGQNTTITSRQEADVF
jgi:hypothetical protein